MILSPEREDQKRIENVVHNFLRNNSLGYVDVQSYADTADAYKEGNKIGLGKELFIIFDERLDPKGDPLRMTGKEKLFRHSFSLSKNVCDERNIPYFMFERKLTREEGEDALKYKISILNLEKRMNDLKEGILVKEEEFPDLSEFDLTSDSP